MVHPVSSQESVPGTHIPLTDPLVLAIQALAQGATLNITFPPDTSSFQSLTVVANSSAVKAEDDVKLEPEFVPQPPIPMSQQAIDAGGYGQDLPDAPKRYYVVTVGLRIGVFMTWACTSPWVSGVSAATFTMFEGANARNRAVTEFNKNVSDGICRIVT
ncbi:hypothetical protein H0H92_001391 [Tricholoma furcatifolium]|nr:hypothetical protein H0H92_001391 [Tricholoma furcatifolium]